MIIRRIVVFSLLAIVLCVAASGGYFVYSQRQAYSITRIGGLEINYILGPADFVQPGTFGEDFDITSSSDLIVRFADALYQIAAAGSVTSSLPVKGAVPQSMAVDNGDALLAVAGGYFGVFNQEGEVVQGVPLPDAEARLARSVDSGVVYLFGGKDRDQRLYRFQEEGTFQVLLESNVPIRAVADTRNAIYFATDRYIGRLDTPSPLLLFRAPTEPEWGRIVSIAVASDDELLFFSTETRVYAWHRGVAISIINNSGGTLRLRGDKLYVLDRKRALLYSARPASRVLFREAGS